MEQSAAAAAIAVVAAVESRCRLCFSADDLTCPLFHSEGDPSREMIDIILECTSIQITLEDDYPSRVCEKCVETLDKFHHYRSRCLENDRILKSHRSTSGQVRVKQEPQQLDEPCSPVAAASTEQQDPAQQVKQEDPGGSSILRSILLQTREPGRAPSSASAEQELELDISEAQIEQKQEELATDEPDAVAPASLLQQMLLQQGFSREPTQPGPSHPGPSPSLLKRMLIEGGSQSPLEGPSHRHDDQKVQPAQPAQPTLPSLANHHQQHDENHNEEHSETPLASQLRAILLQHRAAAAAAAAAAASAGSAAAASSASAGAATPGEKPEVSYLRSLFLRNDSDGNEDSDSESVVATAAATDEPSRELLFSMFQELSARNELNSDDTDDSEDRAFDYRIPAVRRRSSESTTGESRKRRRLDFTCLLCGRPFLNRSKLVLHMRTHIAPPSAPTSESPVAGGSGSGGAGSVAAIVAAAAAAAAVPGAGERNDGGDDDDEESRQIELLERRSYACYICGADQNNLQQLKEHLLLAHQDRIRSRGRAKERPKPLISCNFCNRQFRSQFAYGEHLRTHTGERPFPCDQCDKRFPRRFQLLGHLYNVHKQSWVADESKAKFVKK